jgi:hypothetical protein
MVTAALLGQLTRLDDADLDELSARIEELRRRRRRARAAQTPSDMRVDPRTGLPNVSLGRPVTAAEVRAFLDQDEAW